MNRRVILIAAIGAIIFSSIFLIVKIVQNKGGGGKMPLSSSAEAKKMYKEAVALKESRKLDEAKNLYQKILTEYPNAGNMENIQKELEDVNMKLIYSNTPSPKAVVHEIQSGDSLAKLASKYGTTVNLIKRSNNIKSDTIHVGQKLRIWTGKFSIFVDKSQNILILKSDGEVVKVYHVSTGVNNSTPVGTFKIISKLIDPVWFNKGVVVPPESPENVLGSRWMGFDLAGYGIHGTIEPETIGQQITAGCVRMRNEEVEELYDLIPMSTEVTVVD